MSGAGAPKTVAACPVRAAQWHQSRSLALFGSMTTGVVLNVRVHNAGGALPFEAE